MLYSLFESTNRIPKALFMAGSPGAGKSTMLDQIVSGTDVKRFDIDALSADIAKLRGINVSELPTDYKSEFYKDIDTKYQNRLNHAVTSGANIVVDGTGTSVEKVRQLMGHLEQHGYQIGLAYVWVGLDTALQRNASRQRVEKPQWVEQTWHDAAKNLRVLHGLVDDDKFFFIKNEDGVNNSTVISRANKFLRTR